MEALNLMDAPSVKGRKIMVTGKDGREHELTNKAGKVSELNPERCIGCGVCAYKCPSQSLILVRNQAEHHPPQTGRDWVMQFMADARPVRPVGKE